MNCAAICISYGSLLANKHSLGTDGGCLMTHLEQLIIQQELIQHLALIPRWSYIAGSATCNSKNAHSLSALV